MILVSLICSLGRSYRSEKVIGIRVGIRVR